MKSKLQRCQFISTCCKSSLAGCGLLMSPGINAASLFIFRDDEKPDPKKLNYCGYQCPADCKFKKATEENSLELKKAVYTEWRLKEKYGIEFDASQIFCYGCKTADKPMGIGVSHVLCVLAPFLRTTIAASNVMI